MIATLVLGTVLVVAFSALGSAKLAAHPAMQTRAQHVGFTVDAYRWIGALEVLAALGILAGILVPFLGALAGVGLVLLLAGAVVAHVRNGDGIKELAPALVLSVVAAVFALMVWNLR